MPLGAKIEVDDILLSSGGGGTNAAATFANQGLKAAYCGMVGNDFSGDLIKREMKSLRVDIGLLRTTSAKPTNLSVFLNYPGQDRTILVYRGASDILKKDDIPWSKIKKTKWIYLAPLGGAMAEMTCHIVDFAKKNKIKIALNPGYSQLTLPRTDLQIILSKIDVLLLNKEEASLLTNIPYENEKEIFEKIDGWTKGIVVMTKAEDGVVVSDGRYLYKAGVIKTEAVDKTGAGDAFGSAFITGLVQKNMIIYAIQLGIANSAYCIRKFGAKEGLLKKGQRWPKIEVRKEAGAI